MRLRSQRSIAAALVLAFSTTAAAPVRAQSESPAVEPQITAPRLLDEPSVPYPDGATGEATVLLVVTVGMDGAVLSAVPLEPSIEPFAGQAARAAAAFRFEPARRGGRPVAAKIRLALAFHPPATRDEVPASGSAAARSEGPTPHPAAAPARPVSSTVVTDVEEVFVHGTRPEPSRTATLSRAEVRQIPGTFGDPFRAVEVMPGVTPIVSGLPFFFVRGAPPGDVGYLLDGIRVPYLFHVGAGPSVIHPAVVDHVDLYPGGYPARYGRFSGGIVAGETTREAGVLHGEANARLFDAGALVEAPLDAGHANVLLGGRYSFTALLLSLLSPNTTLDYWDYQGRASYRPTPRDEVGVFAFGARDYLAQKGTSMGTQTVFDAQFHRVDLRYDHALGDLGGMRTAATAGVDDTVVGGGFIVRDRLLGAREELSYRLSRGALLRAGADVELDAYDIVVTDPQQLGSDQAAFDRVFPSRSDIAFGVRADAVVDVARGLEATPGLRLDAFVSGPDAAFAVDPRLSMRTALARRAHLLSTFGVAHQVPAFVVPLPGFQPAGLRDGLQTAVQESLGFEVDLDDATKATATLFHNAFFGMNDALDSAPVGTNLSSGSDSTRTPSSILEQRTDGTAYGLEVFVNRKLTRRIGGFLSYTLSRSIRVAGGKRFVAPFDRSHVFNAAAAYELGRGYRVGARLTFYTGLPETPQPGDPSPRLPPFFRIDVRFEKRWALGTTAWISFVAEWLNATLNKEAIGTNCSLGGCTETTVGPVSIPSLGAEGGF